MVPIYATTPVLLLVGASMFRSVAGIAFDRLEDALPAFVTIVLIPLTFSITQGILWGFIAHVGLYAIAGRWRDVHPIMYVLGAIAVGLLALEHGTFG
jgi:AGZA family xanthine/uracil permease-like MFS transporter